MGSRAVIVPHRSKSIFIHGRIDMGMEHRFSVASMPISCYSGSGTHVDGRRTISRGDHRDGRPRSEPPVESPGAPALNSLRPSTRLPSPGTVVRPTGAYPGRARPASPVNAADLRLPSPGTVVSDHLSGVRPTGPVNTADPHRRRTFPVAPRASDPPRAVNPSDKPVRL